MNTNTNDNSSFISRDYLIEEIRKCTNKDMHYLYPLERSSKLIETHDMVTFDTILPSDSNITCRKEKVSGKDKFLYSFRDARQAAKEEQDWLRRAKKDGGFSHEELAGRKKTFGTIVFECDLDLPLEVVYKRIRCDGRSNKDRLLDKRTYKDVINVLRHAKKVRVDDSGWQMVKCWPAHGEIMQTLGLLPKPDKRKRGRPKKN